MLVQVEIWNNLRTVTVSHHASVQSFYFLMSLQLLCYPMSFIPTGFYSSDVRTREFVFLQYFGCCIELVLLRVDWTI